jgi:hypothetical protein
VFRTRDDTWLFGIALGRLLTHPGDTDGTGPRDRSTVRRADRTMSSKKRA